jgi:hypothetical protein
MEGMPMIVDPVHHNYNIQLTEIVFQLNLSFSQFSSASPNKAIPVKEIKQLCKIGVLEWQCLSRWALPTFIVPQKDSTLQTTSEFREINKRIAWKPYPTTKISRMLQKLQGFTHATSLDLNIGYYTIRLDPVASMVCTIICS